jgi:hypothetical protein
LVSLAFVSQTELAAERASAYLLEEESGQVLVWFGSTKDSSPMAEKSRRFHCSPKEPWTLPKRFLDRLGAALPPLVDEEGAQLAALDLRVVVVVAADAQAQPAEKAEPAVVPALQVVPPLGEVDVDPVLSASAGLP